MSVTIEQFAGRWMAWRYANFNELWEPKHLTSEAVDQRRIMSTKAKEALPMDIDWGSVEGGNSEFGVQYPRMQWQHGDAKASGFMKTGGLFINKDEYPNFPGEGFEPATLITDDGKEIAGYGSPGAKLAVIRVKHEWHTDKDSGRNIPFVHALCYVKGCDDPVNFSLRSPSKALEFQKAFNQHMAQNVSVANKSRPAGAPALEPFALWFPVQASAPVAVQSKDGKAKSMVTPPTLSVPATIDRAYAVSLWVGTENYKNFVATWKDTAEWQKLPIWEDRAAPADGAAPEFTGGYAGEYRGGDADPATDQQLDFLISLANAKGVNLAEYMLEYTNGGSNDVGNLTKAEARAFTDRISAM